MTTSIPVILAFGFASPWLLGGLLLAGIPVVIHLLHKRRYVEVHWAAMRFLLEATRKQSRRMRLENLILLLLRTLLLVLLVVALARPHFDSVGSVLQREQPAHRIVVLDASFSMQFIDPAADAWDADQPETPGPKTRFARGIDTLRTLLENGRRGDAWNLVLISGSEPFAMISRPAFGPETVLAELEGLTPSDSPGDLAGALEAARQLTELLPELPRKEVILISDLQASMWAPEAPRERSRVATTIRKISERAKVSLVNVAGSGAGNAAVTSLTSEVGSGSVGEPVAIRSLVRNFGSTALRDQVLELLIDGRLVDTRRLDLPPGSDVPVDWSHTFRTPGEVRVEVHLQDDALPVDNRRWLPIAIQEQINVLIVDGRPSGRRREAASFYVARALSPMTADDSTPGLFRTQVIGDGELLSVNLARFDALVLCNVGLVTDREAAQVEAFVRSGGGLLVLPGDQVSADNYNQRLYRDGAGILPGRVLETVEAPDADSVFTFDAHDFAHPLVRVFRGNPGAGLESTMTLRFLRLAPAPDAEVALWFSDGSPALIARQAGSGRVVLAATSADERWGTWAVWAPSFVPVMNEALQYSISGRWGQRQVLVGETIAANWPARLFDMPVSIDTPDGDVVSLQVQERGDVIAAAFDDTRRAGVYLLKLGAPLNRAEVYAVNVETRESDLIPAARGDLQSGLFNGIELAIRSGDDPEPVFVTPQYDSGLSILSRVLAWLVLIGLLIEPLLAWRFSAGFVALIVVTASALLIPLMGPWPAGTLLMASVAIVAWRRHRSAMKLT